MNISDAFKAVRACFGLTQKQIGDLLGLSQAYVSDIERGHATYISDDAVAAMIAYCETSGQTECGIIVEDLRQALATSKPERRANVRAVQSDTPADLFIPWYTTTVRAGNGAPIFGEAVERFNVASHYKGTAVYEVSGDSMIDVDVHEGDRLVVRLGALFRNGDIILCRYNGELMVKGAAVRDGTIWIYPANPKYHPWALKEGDQFECVGTVIEIIRKPRRVSWQQS